MININKFLQSRLLKNASILFSSQSVNVFLGLGITVLIAKNISINEYGEYGLFFTFQGVASLLVEFGLFIAVSRRVALSENSEHTKQVIGAGFLLFIMIATFYAFFNFTAGFIVDNFFQVKIGYILKKWWWLTFALPINYFMYNVLEGKEKIKTLSLYLILTKSTFLSLLLILKYYKTLTIDTTIVSFFAPNWIWGTLFVIKLKPSFKNITENIKIILKDTKEYAFNIFISYFIGFLGVKLDQFFIALFFSSKEMGYYHLAANLAHPLTLFSKSASTSAFKKITVKRKFPKHFLMPIFIISIFGGVALTLIVPYIITPIFSEKFLPLLSFFPLVVLYHIFYAFRYPFGVFFKARAQGDIILKISIMFLILISVFQVIINNNLGIYGPAIAMNFASLLTLIVIWIYFSKYKN